LLPALEDKSLHKTVHTKGNTFIQTGLLMEKNEPMKTPNGHSRETGRIRRQA
jgi:hypothetical protein